MKKSELYTMAFTIGLCAACAFVLTFASVRLQNRISANENFEKIKAIVTALRLSPEEPSRDAVLKAYHDAVEVAAKGEIEVFEGHRDGTLVGYAMEVVGRGKYGPIKGILAFDAGGQTILGFEIYEQNETPGLGGRIASSEWLEKFRHVPLVTAGVPGVVISSREKGPNVIDGITGASKTTYQVAKLVNTAIASFLAGGRQLEELDLGLGMDAVTRATPGYPKNLTKPINLREEQRRAPFMVPPGLVNLALHKPVTSGMEDEPVIGELAQITDGIKKSGEFDYVELDLGPQWVQIDLGAEAEIYAIVIWHFYRNPVIYNDVIVQVANDEAFAGNVTTLFNNDADNSSGLGVGADTAYYARWWGEIVDARGADGKGVRARYVRGYTNGGAGDEATRFVEIAVYGK